MTISRATTRTVALAILMALTLAVTMLSSVTAISNGSRLEFLTQPATANVGATITSIVGMPVVAEEDRIRVAIFNGSGDRQRIGGIPIRLEIVGTGAEGVEPSSWRELTNEDGVAVFTPSIDREGIGFRLIGKAADTASEASGTIQSTEPSQPFDIRIGALTDCQRGHPCDDDAVGDNTDAALSASADGYLVLDLGSVTLVCEGYAASSEMVTFDVTDGTDGTRPRVTITLDAASVTKPAKKYQVCFSSDKSFIDASGNTVPAGGAGLLADCPRNLQPENEPCVLSRTKDRSGNVVVTFSVRLGDPRGVI